MRACDGDTRCIYIPRTVKSVQMGFLQMRCGGGGGGSVGGGQLVVMMVVRWWWCWLAGGGGRGGVWGRPGRWG